MELLPAMRRYSAAAAALIGLLATTACQGAASDGMGSAAAPPKTSTSARPSPSDEADVPSRPATPTAKPLPQGAAAKGPKLRTDVVDLRMPRGWTVDSDVSDGYYQSASDARSRSKVTLYTSTLAEGEPSPSLLSMVDAGLRYARQNVSKEARQLPNVRIDGEIAVRIRARHDDGGNWFEEFNAIRDRDLVTLQIEVDGSAKQRDRIVNSILTTWTWQDA